MDNETMDFEFERRFFVSALPTDLLRDVNPHVIVQTYFFSRDGYALRIRLQASNCPVALPLNADGKTPIELFEKHFNLCMLTVKGPMNCGTRYEAERELDIGIGIEMCLRGGITMSKRRYGLWLDQDGWVIDQFCGSNAPLVIAECERTGPVTDLAIPSFCDAEVTEDRRFSNDALIHHPFSQWEHAYRHELSTRVRNFSESFGDNTASAL